MPASTRKSGTAAAKRAGRHRERADQAVAREGARALLVGDAVRQHGVLERHQHAEVAGRRIDRADERDERDEGDVLESSETRARCMPSGTRPPSSRVRRSWRGATTPTASVSSAVPSSDAVATMPICDRVVTDRGQIGRQDDDGEAVAEAAHAARGIEQQDIGRRPGAGHGSVLISMRSNRVTLSALVQSATLPAPGMFGRLRCKASCRRTRS